LWINGLDNYNTVLAYKDLVCTGQKLEFEKVNSNIKEFKQSTRKIYISGINSVKDTDILSTLFSVYGEVEKASIKFNKEDGRNRGFGFVIFRANKMAEEAVLKSGSLKYDGKKNKVQICNS